MMDGTSRLYDAIESMGGGAEYDQRVTATVIGKDSDGTVWVNMPGGARMTPASSSVEVAQGDVVSGVVSGNRFVIDRNMTDPSAGTSSVVIAAARAGEAQRTADVAATAAQSAVVSAGLAAEAASQAIEDAAEVAENLEQAQQDAATAKSMAQSASTSAASALASAAAASSHANEALVQLSVVQDVAGTLDWISDHGTFSLTADTAIMDGKVYFTYDSQSGDYTPVAEPRVEDISTYYELDIADSQTEYIMAHLAVTSRGLWVLPSGKASGTTPASGETQADSDCRQASNYKTLLSSSGMEVYDGSGASVARYGTSAQIGSETGYHTIISRYGVETKLGADRLISATHDGTTARIYVGASDGQVAANKAVDVYPQGGTVSQAVFRAVFNNPGTGSSFPVYERNSTNCLGTIRIADGGMSNWWFYEITGIGGRLLYGAFTCFEDSLVDMEAAIAAGGYTCGGVQDMDMFVDSGSDVTIYTYWFDESKQPTRVHDGLDIAVSSILSPQVEIPDSGFIIESNATSTEISVGAGTFAINDTDVEVEQDLTVGDTATFLGDIKVGSTAANARQVYPYLVFNALAWTSANLSACQAAVANYRPCVARFSNGAVVEFDGDPQTDVYS